MVTVSDVRTFLNNIDPELISDTVIQKQIDLAGPIVDAAKSKDASASDVDKAKLVYAGYLSYLAYTTEEERATGALPAAVSIRLVELKELAMTYLRLIATDGYNVEKLLPVAETIPSLASEEFSYDP